MTEDNTTPAVEPQEESTTEGESALVKDLRNQIKAKDRIIASTPNRAEVEAEIRAAVAREKAIESELVALKLPAGLSETVEGKLGGAEVTREKVMEALTAIGFQVTAEADGGSGESGDSGQTAQDLANVANLGSQVAQAAAGGDTDSLTDKINAAQTREELSALMSEAGLGQ